MTISASNWMTQDQLAEFHVDSNASPTIRGAKMWETYLIRDWYSYVKRSTGWQLPSPAALSDHLLRDQQPSTHHQPSRATLLFDGIYDVLGGEENAPLWDYIPSGPFLDCPEFHAALNSSLDRFPNSFPYTIIDNTSQNPVRSLDFIYIDQLNRSIQAGYVLISRFFGTPLVLERSYISSPVLSLIP